MFARLFNSGRGRLSLLMPPMRWPSPSATAYCRHIATAGRWTLIEFLLSMKWSSVVLLLVTASILPAQALAPAAVPAPTQATITYIFDWPAGYSVDEVSPLNVQAYGRQPHFNGNAASRGEQPGRHRPGASRTSPCRPATGRGSSIWRKSSITSRAICDAHIKHIAQTGQKGAAVSVSCRLTGWPTFNWSRRNP